MIQMNNLTQPGCRPISIKLVTLTQFKTQPLRTRHVTLFAGDTNLLLENSYELAETCFATLRTQAIAEGWQMSPILLAADEWRATWQMEGSGDKVL